MTKAQLPENFRIETRLIGGTGMGDEDVVRVLLYTRVERTRWRKKLVVRDHAIWSSPRADDDAFIEVAHNYLRMLRSLKMAEV